MPIEKTVLSLRAIECLLNRHYGLPFVNAESIPRGTANCYRIDTGEADLFLKEYPSWTKVGNVRQEGKLIQYLNQHSFPVSTLMHTLSGEYYCVFEDHILSVQRFIHGKTYSDHDLPDDLLMDSAELLGKMHALLQDYNLPVDMSSEWIRGFDLRRQQAKYSNLLNALASRPDDEYSQMIREDLLYKRDLLVRVEPFGSLFEGLTYSSSNGDYNSLQLICDADEIKAVIDFSTAKKLPVTWELARNYMQSGSVDGSFNAARFKQYLSRYQKYSPLNKHDLRCILNVYLYQLARSSYGYREYLEKKALNADGLLKFAHWRTEMCRSLEQMIPLWLDNSPALSV